MNKIFPGKNNPEDILIPDYRLYRHMIRFMGNIYGMVADIGETNAKSQYLSEAYNIPIAQINCEDFNTPSFTGKYTTVFCFEVLEHVQNPLSFMEAVNNITEKHGVIYLSTPARFRFMWSKHHFVEHTPKHWDKWIFSQLGLVVVKKKRVPLKVHWTINHFIGLRPLLRLPFLFFNYTWMYKIKQLGP